nr:hypothetical protein [Tanacetum cinerariifolium]
MLVAREPEAQIDAEEQGNDDNAAEEPVTVVDDVEDQSIPSPTPPTPPSQQPQDIPSTSQAKSPPLQPQSLTPAQPQGVDFPMSLLQEALDTCAALTRRVEHLEHDKVGTSQRIELLDDTIMEDVSNQGRMIDELDKDEGAVLMNEKEETEEVKDITGDAQVEGRHVEIYQIDMDHAAKLLSMQEDEPEIQEAVEVVTTAKLITKVIAAVSETVNAAPVVPTVTTVVVPTITTASVKVAVPFTRRRRGVVIRDPKEESSAKTPTETKSKDKGKGIMVEEPKPLKKKQQVELDEAAQQHLKIVSDEDDDVYTEDTPFSRKVPAVDYQIVHFNNKPHYKIIHADGTYQLYMSFITLLKKFDREDLESLWSMVKERFSTSKPNNFSDDFLLITFKAMFGRPDGQDQVWMNQRSVHGQAKVKTWKLLESCGVHIVALTTTRLIMLVERRYQLSRFTLDQMLNTVWLRVEKHSEMSLELIRFTRQQLQEGQHN